MTLYVVTYELSGNEGTDTQILGIFSSIELAKTLVEKNILNEINSFTFKDKGDTLIYSHVFDWELSTHYVIQEYELDKEI